MNMAKATPCGLAKRQSQTLHNCLPDVSYYASLTRQEANFQLIEKCQCCHKNPTPSAFIPFNPVVNIRRCCK